MNIAQSLDDMRTHFGLKLNLVYCRAHTFLNSDANLFGIGLNSDANASSCYGNHLIEIIRLDAFKGQDHGKHLRKAFLFRRNMSGLCLFAACMTCS